MNWKFEKEFREAHPETIGETDKNFDLDNYKDWLEQQLVKLKEAKSNFKLISNGYDEELLSDRMHIKSGDNADVHLIKTDCGFIIDVYASSDDDYIDSMTIYDDDLNQPNMDEF